MRTSFKYRPFADLLQGIEWLPASHNCAPDDGNLADPQVLHPANLKAADEAEGDPRDGRTSHLREPEPGHCDQVGVQGQEEAAAAAAETATTAEK